MQTKGATSTHSQNQSQSKTILEDAELDDLISTEKNANGNGNGNGNGNDQRLSSYYNYRYNSNVVGLSSSSSFSSKIAQVPTLLLYMCMSFLLQFPRTSKVITVGFLVFLLFVLVSLTSQGKTVEIGTIGYDFTRIHSQYDFDIGKVDHWCIDVSKVLVSNRLYSRLYSRLYRQS